MIKRFLFPTAINTNNVSIGLLILRIVFGGMLFMNHGLVKLMNFNAIAPEFMGGKFALGLAVFAEFFCAAGIIVGLLHRLALIPLIITMSVAFFVAHGAKLTGEGNGEMALVYLAVFVTLFIIGAGKYSIDNYIAKKI